MESFDQIVQRYLALQWPLLKAVKANDRAEIMAAEICNDAANLLSENNEELVQGEIPLPAAPLITANAEAKASPQKLSKDQKAFNKREERLKQALEKLSKGQQDLNEREKAHHQAHKQINTHKDQTLTDHEYWASEETDCEENRALFVQDLHKIKDEQAKIIQDQAKLIQDQAKLKEDELRFLEAQKIVQLNHTNSLRELERRVDAKCERLRDELSRKEERLKEEQLQMIRDKNEQLEAQYEMHLANLIAQEKRELESKYYKRKEGLEQQLQLEHAIHIEELNEEKEETEAMRQTLTDSVAAMKSIKGSLDTLTAQQLGRSEVIETLLCRQSQEGVLISALHHAHEVAAGYFSQLDSVTQSLEEERRLRIETCTMLTSASAAAMQKQQGNGEGELQIRELVAGREREKATFEGRLETVEEQLQQEFAAHEEEKKHENNKNCSKALRTTQLGGSQLKTRRKRGPAQ
ncbi:hypothetical protein N0V84_001367 [Fusarium piperis]|uniref:Uncharacterized protein n=1 Tax=Fusarium piperis TaxID=1435070 RepID=A0A9W8WLD3_9HYPO|nr:hypothetical protein N0V84_001367 [Fusarium piperis]